MRIENYSFGSIKIDGEVYTKDLWIINGKIEKRDKSISKSRFGTSHKIPRKELKKVITSKTKKVIVGSGDSGLVSLTDKAVKYLEEKRIKLEICKTGDLALRTMEFSEEDSGIIHITC
jgi:hypothetical protein